MKKIYSSTPKFERFIEDGCINGFSFMELIDKIHVDEVF